MVRRLLTVTLVAVWPAIAAVHSVRPVDRSGHRRPSGAEREGEDEEGAVAGQALLQGSARVDAHHHEAFGSERSGMGPEYGGLSSVDQAQLEQRSSSGDWGRFNEDQVEDKILVHEAHRQRDHGRWVSAFAVAILLLLALAPVLYSQGPVPFLAVVCYIASLCFVKVTAKQAFTQGFHFPYTLTAFHMLVTSVVASLIERPLWKEGLPTFKISSVKAISLGLNNTALAFGTASFVSIIGALTPCTTFAIDVLRTRQMPLFKTCAIIIACTGAGVCTGGELKFSLLAFLLALGACVTRSLKTVWSHDLLEADVGVYRLAAWSSIWSFVIMIIIGLSLEGARPYKALNTIGPAGIAALLVSSVCAAALNILQCFVLKFLGPVVQSAFGALELVAVIIIAILMLGEEVTRTEWLGVVLVCIGCAGVKAEDTLRQGAKMVMGRFSGSAGVKGVDSPQKQLN